MTATEGRTETPCRSGHTDCTVDCGWCKGTGVESRPGRSRTYTVEGHEHLYSAGERCVRCYANRIDVELGQSPKECPDADDASECPTCHGTGTCRKCCEQ